VKLKNIFNFITQVFFFKKKNMTQNIEPTKTKTNIWTNQIFVFENRLKCMNKKSYRSKKKKKKKKKNKA
jgi:hypothetical protein